MIQFDAAFFITIPILLNVIALNFFLEVGAFDNFMFKVGTEILWLVHIFNSLSSIVNIMAVDAVLI